MTGRERKEKGAGAGKNPSTSHAKKKEGKELSGIYGRGERSSPFSTLCYVLVTQGGKKKREGAMGARRRGVPSSGSCSERRKKRGKIRGAVELRSKRKEKEGICRT